MRPPSPHSRDRTSWNGRESTATTATETDPLLLDSASASTRRSNRTESHGGSIRARRSSRSPTVSLNRHFGSVDQRQEQLQMNVALAANQPENDLQQDYNIIHDDTSRSGNLSLSGSSRQSTRSGISNTTNRRQYLSEKRSKEGGVEHPPLLEIPEEVYGVRKAALAVLKPLTKTWVRISCSILRVKLF